MIYIVLPAYNEADTLPPLLSSIRENMLEFGRSYKVLVVNDGSTDSTQSVLERESLTMPITIVNQPTNRGLAEAIRLGLSIAVEEAQERDIIITMDSDNTHTPGLIQRMVRMVREGHDVVIGSRYQAGGRVIGVPWFRRLLSWGGSMIFRFFFPIQGVRDYTCGYRAYAAQALKDMFAQYREHFISETGFSCMVDILLKMRRHDFIFGEVPLVLRYDFKVGKSKMRVGQTMRETISLLVRRRLGK